MWQTEARLSQALPCKHQDGHVGLTSPGQERVILVPTAYRAPPGALSPSAPLSQPDCSFEAHWDPELLPFLGLWAGAPTWNDDSGSACLCGAPATPGQPVRVLPSYAPVCADLCRSCFIIICLVMCLFSVRSFPCPKLLRLQLAASGAQ